MSDKKDAIRSRKEQLFSVKKNGYDRFPAERLPEMDAYCRDYMAFLDAGKTERLCAAEVIRLAEAAGYVPYERGMALAAGSKVYVCNRGKGVMLACLGRELLDAGARISAAHIRLSPPGLKAQPPV